MDRNQWTFYWGIYLVNWPFVEFWIRESTKERNWHFYLFLSTFPHQICLRWCCTIPQGTFWWYQSHGRWWCQLDLSKSSWSLEILKIWPRNLDDDFLKECTSSFLLHLDLSIGCLRYLRSSDDCYPWSWSGTFPRPHSGPSSTADASNPKHRQWILVRF